MDGAETTVSLFSVLSTWEKSFLIKNCMTLLNSYSPAEVRGLSLGKSITLIDKNFFSFFIGYEHQEKVTQAMQCRKPMPFQYKTSQKVSQNALYRHSYAYSVNDSILGLSCSLGCVRV